MDPINNPQPAQNPGVGTVGTPPVAPSVDTGTTPTAVPDLGVNPTATPEAPVVGAPSVGANPVVGVPDTTGLVTPTPTGTPGLDGLPMTEPIMRPDLPPAPDPVKQELEAPMKAAAPVPGSIGSAVSVPEGGATPDPAATAGADAQFGPNAGGATPSVSFNDPAAAAQPNQQQPNTPAAPAAKEKKKLSFNFDIKNMNKGVLIALIVVAAMIVIGLAAVLIMQLL